MSCSGDDDSLVSEGVTGVTGVVGVVDLAVLPGDASCLELLDLELSLSLARSFPLSEGQVQSKQSRLQSPHLGFVSSHFFFRLLQTRHPVCTRLIWAFGISAVVAPGSFESRGIHGNPSLIQREHGIFPSQACFICAQRKHTGRGSATIVKRNKTSPKASPKSRLGVWKTVRWEMCGR